MGADLYIKKMPRAKQMKYVWSRNIAVKHGYFRDCYNSYGLFAVVNATLGTKLCWETLFKDKDLFKGSVMKIRGVRAWLLEIKPTIFKFMQAEKMYHMEYEYDNNKELVCVHKELDQNKVSNYREWALTLIKFIDLAIEKKSQIIFHV